GKCLTCCVSFHRGMVISIDGQEMVERRRFRIDSNPDLLGMKVLDNASEAANMVPMSVCQGDHVNMIKAAGPEIGRHHVFTKIEFAVHRADAASTINEHGGSVRRNYQNGISLADIDHRDLKYAMVQRRRSAGQPGKDGDRLAPNRDQRNHDCYGSYDPDGIAGLRHSPLRDMEPRKPDDGCD